LGCLYDSNREIYLKLKETTPARVGIWRSGPRPLTRALLRFRADHADALDAVFKNVSEQFITSLNLETIQSCCKDKDQFLTRPDLGRKLDDATAKRLKKICPANARVQIYIADGLSATAIEVNAGDAFKSIVQGLKGYGIETGTPFFLKFGRVPSMDTISELLTPEVTIVLIGERPGLATAESMSCYMAYKASTTMPEANRTVISNIHNGGTPAVEAGAHIAEVIKKMLDQKASGLNLK
jgi:ethanolamine ammonia-lyase small subunit